jgi:hypothetical protein
MARESGLVEYCPSARLTICSSFPNSHTQPQPSAPLTHKYKSARLNMQLRTLLTVATTIALAIVSITDATEAVAMGTVPVGRALGNHSPQPEKTKPMGRALGDHTYQPQQTIPTRRALGNHSPQPEKTKPMGRALGDQSAGLASGNGRPILRGNSV